MKYILTILAFCSFLQIHAQKLIHKELLGRPTDKNIDIQLMFSENADVSIQYGTQSGVYPNQTPWLSFNANTPAEFSLAGLTPNTTYFYRVQHKLTGTSNITTRPEFSFKTAKPQGTSFTFVVQADPHLDGFSDTALYRRCLQNELDDKPDFVIDLGDFLMTDKLTNSSKKITRDTIVSRCHLLRSYYETVAHSVPLYIALGNHEGEAGWYLTGQADNIANWNVLERKKYFMNPAPNGFYTGDTISQPFVGIRENYYEWQWGDAQFIVLDPYWYTNPKPDSLNGWRWTLGKTQYDWLKKTLEKSTSKYKFVFSHQIIGGDPEGRGGVEFADRYEWGGQSLNGNYDFASKRPGWYKPIKDLLTEHKVNIFFHGHDHFFGKQEKDCMIYQETPQPSLPNFQNANQATDYGYKSGQILPNAGHLRINVSPQGVKVDYVRAYLPKNETGSRKNKDISATYYIAATNCYDSLTLGIPTLWNSNYTDEIIYPNPFENETKIQLSFNQSQKINLMIYNNNGIVVRKLLNESEVPEGKFEIIWDGKDANGSLVPSGIYWYSIESEIGSKKSGKVVISR